MPCLLLAVGHFAISEYFFDVTMVYSVHLCSACEFRCVTDRSIWHDLKPVIWFFISLYWFSMDSFLENKSPVFMLAEISEFCLGMIQPYKGIQHIRIILFELKDIFRSYWVLKGWLLHERKFKLIKSILWRRINLI